MQRLSQIRKLSVPQTAPSYWLSLQVPVLPWAQTPLRPVELHWVWTAIDLPTDFSEKLAAAGPASPYRWLSSLYISAVETYFPGLRSKAWDWITPQTKSYLCLHLIFLYGGCSESRDCTFLQGTRPLQSSEADGQVCVLARPSPVLFDLLTLQAHRHIRLRGGFSS